MILFHDWVPAAFGIAVFGVLLALGLRVLLLKRQLRHLGRATLLRLDAAERKGCGIRNCFLVHFSHFLLTSTPLGVTVSAAQLACIVQSHYASKGGRDGTSNLVCDWLRLDGDHDWLR